MTPSPEKLLEQAEPLFRRSLELMLRFREITDEGSNGINKVVEAFNGPDGDKYRSGELEFVAPETFLKRTLKTGEDEVGGLDYIGHIHFNRIHGVNLILDRWKEGKLNAQDACKAIADELSYFRSEHAIAGYRKLLRQVQEASPAQVSGKEHVQQKLIENMEQTLSLLLVQQEVEKRIISAFPSAKEAFPVNDLSNLGRR